VAGAIIFPILATSHRSLYGQGEGFAAWLVRSIIMGLILGMGAWAVHDKILSKYEDKVPGLKGFVGMVDRAGNKPEDPKQ